MISDEFEQKAWSKNNHLLAFDEAGMGCFAGSMFVGGVVFPMDFDFKDLGLNDSKKLTEKRRFEIEKEIKDNALIYRVGIVSPKEIEDKSAYHTRMSTCLDIATEIFALNTDKEFWTILDGNKEVPYLLDSHCMVKGDAKCYSIAAASILAKCAKDREMYKLDEKHPEYQWAKNKGYGTKTHREAIKKYGITHYHRKNYCEKTLRG